MHKKVLIVSEGGGSSSYHKPFRKFGDQVHDSNLLWTNPEEIALVVFTGGADVTPALYGQEASQATCTVPRRDIYESITFHRAKQLRKPMAGICRGSQFLNVMAGGKLVQHLDGHGVWHNMRTCDDKVFEVSSTHHQMMLPPEGAKVIGWSEKRRSNRYCGENNEMIKAPEREYEVIYWPNIRAVGMQYHPEIMGEFQLGFLFASQLVERYLLA